MDTVVAELVTFFQALKGGSLFALAPVLIGLALTIAAVAYQVIAIRRFQAASKATQENFETIAADLRKRALEVKKQDEGLRKRDLEAKEGDELKGFVKDANAELTERIMSSVLRLTSNLIDGLEVLSSELQQLQTFLKSEVERCRVKS